MGQISVDLSKAHLTRQHGDLLAVYTWVNDERALILIPAYRKNAAWYIVCESAAYKYDNRQYLALQCKKAAEVLGMESSPNNWIKLATIIHDGLPDLITMPSAPDPALTRGTYGEVKILADGQLLGGEEARMPVESGATYG
jgi:hypothetical protein